MAPLTARGVISSKIGLSAPSSDTVRPCSKARAFSLR